MTGSGKALETHLSQAVEGHLNQALQAQSSHTLEAHSSQAFESASKFSSLSKYPTYSCILPFSYVRISYMYVPSSFVKKMNAASGSIKVKLQCRGKEWDAVVNTYGITTKINIGWSKFARDNSLQIGDVCVFELIKQKDAVIRVTVFKCIN
ncbi:hypothetical protein POM88_029551 [Heracleum sosnowskyi]|uniref:TF-B3 domain-containing protein n=1 Tax=Heracleum sosnowskyi TaxID=360622 RepID=A0AAD8HUY7_9APIA|nr:hypothetical protein POM88_029551 [Heracleum sosnowskyi]